MNQKDPEALVTHQNRLDNTYKDFLTNYNIILIVSDTSVKNDITTSILYIYKD